MVKKQSLRFYLRISGILLLICALVAVMLAGIHLLTKDTIAAHKAEAIHNAIQTLFANGFSIEHTVPDGHKNVQSAYIVRNTGDGVLLGYCYIVTANGFGGEMELMVGLHPNNTIAGVEVIDHSETSGIGTNVLNATYLTRYKGKSGTLVLGTDIDAHSGATISSKAVLSGVNAALSAHTEMQNGAYLTGGESSAA